MFSKLLLLLLLLLQLALQPRWQLCSSWWRCGHNEVGGAKVPPRRRLNLQPSLHAGRQTASIILQYQELCLLSCRVPLFSHQLMS
jgi:hypothetical protein